VDILTIRTIDAHVEGAPLRLVIGGFPAAVGATMLDKRAWLTRRAEGYRRALLLGPRGHADLMGAVLTEPTSPGSHAGLLSMDGSGFGTACAQAAIAAATIGLERGLIMPGGDGRTIVFDTPSGSIRARATFAPHSPEHLEHPEHLDTRVLRVGLTNVPSFVLSGGLAVPLRPRPVRADVAFAGAFYAIVDSETVGQPIAPDHLPSLRRIGMEIKAAIEAAHDIVHPIDSRLAGIHGVIFTAPASGAADLRDLTVLAGGQVDLSPSAAGTAAVMAVLDAMGLLDDHARFVQEGLLGTQVSGRIAGRTMVGAYPAITPEIDASAWITGEHALLLHPDDPFREGFRV
jgi:proline racemase